MSTPVPKCHWVRRWRTRMLPGMTCSSPNRFTPRRLEWESRLFLDEAAKISVVRAVMDS